MQRLILAIAFLAGTTCAAQAQSPQCAETAAIWSRLRTNGTTAELNALLAVAPPACTFERAAAQARLRELAGPAKPTGPAAAAKPKLLTAATATPVAATVAVQVGSRTLALPKTWTKELVLKEKGAYAALIDADQNDRYEEALSDYRANPAAAVDVTGRQLGPPSKPTPLASADGYYMVGQSFQSGAAGVGALLLKQSGVFTVVAGHTLCGLQKAANPPLNMLTYLGPEASPRYTGLAEEVWLAAKTDFDAVYDSAIQNGVATTSANRVAATWVKKPTAYEFERYFPERAMEREKSGKVVMRCLVRSGKASFCAAEDETPTGWGFAAAGEKIARSFQFALTDMTDPNAESCVTVPLTFTFPN